jgi:hypothetical protein
VIGAGSIAADANATENGLSISLLIQWQTAAEYVNTTNLESVP